MLDMRLFVPSSAAPTLALSRIKAIRLDGNVEEVRQNIWVVIVIAIWLAIWLVLERIANVGATYRYTQ